MGWGEGKVVGVRCLVEGGGCEVLGVGCGRVADGQWAEVSSLWTVVCGMLGTRSWRVAFHRDRIGEWGMGDG